METQTVTLKPTKPIYFSFYQFDHKSEPKWETRECGSIANNAALLWSHPTKKEADEYARTFVDEQRGEGWDMRLGEWEFHTQRYYQIYPIDAESAALLKMIKSLTWEEFKLVKSYLQLPRVCDGCHMIKLEVATLCKYSYDTRHDKHESLLLCPPCFKGYIQAETVWGPPHYNLDRYSIKRDGAH